MSKDKSTSKHEKTEPMSHRKKEYGNGSSKAKPKKSAPKSKSKKR